jgi:hypothetical protein
MSTRKTLLWTAAPALLCSLAAPAAAQPILGTEAEFARVSAQAKAAFSAGRYRDALMIARDAHAFAAAELGPDHPLTLQTLNDIAVIHHIQGDFATALPMALAAAGGLERALGPDHPETLTAVANLAQLHVERGAPAEAEPLLRRVLAGRERKLGAGHEASLNALLELAVFLKRQGRLAELKTELERGAARARTAFGTESAIATDLTAAAAEAAGRKAPEAEAG